MTFRELINSGLFSPDTYIYVEGKTNTLKFDKQVTFRNANEYFLEKVLNREVALVDAYEYNVMLIYFKETK